MRNLNLILCFVALAGSITSGVLGWRLGDSKQRLTQELTRERARVASLEINLASATAAEERLRRMLQNTDADLTAARSAATDARERAASLLNEHDAAVQAAAEVTARSERLTAENETLRTELITQRNRLARSLPPEDAAQFRATIADLEAEVARLEETTRELQQLTATARVELTANRGQHAQVVGLGPRNAFVIINFGTRHGASIDQQFDVTRGADVLAIVKISQTMENYSIAQVIPDSLSGSIRKGDAASLTL